MEVSRESLTRYLCARCSFNDSARRETTEPKLFRSFWKIGGGKSAGVLRGETTCSGKFSLPSFEPSGGSGSNPDREVKPGRRAGGRADRRLYWRAFTSGRGAPPPSMYFFISLPDGSVWQRPVDESSSFARLSIASSTALAVSHSVAGPPANANQHPHDQRRRRRRQQQQQEPKTVSAAKL